MSGPATIDDAGHRQIAAMLGRDDHRYTPGRRRLVEVLAAAGRPITLPEVLDADDGLTQSSVYRNLDVLEQVGAIRRVVTGGEHAHFELAEPLLDHHHHLICTACGGVEDVELDAATERAVDDALHRAARDVGFHPEHHSLDLHGRCADCA